MRTEKNSRYQWIIVACCFAMTFTVLGFGSSPRKLFMVAVPKALGLDYGPYSFNDSCRFLASAVINLLFGTLIQRFGPRKLIAAGFATLVCSMLVYSFAETLPLVYLGGVLLGVGLGLTGTTVSSYIINLWFTRNKGTITGLVLCANGLGGAVAMQVLSPIIESGLFAYRNAYRLSALVMAVVGVLVVAFIRAPEKGQALPAAEKKKAKTDWEGISFQEALRRPYFYLIAACVFLTGMVLQSLTGSDANHLRSVGLDAGYVATVLSVHSMVLAGTKFITGMLFDRKGLRFTLMVCNIAALITLLMLIFVTDSAAGKVMAAVYAVLVSLALPLETIMLPLITADLFGQRSYAQMLGIISAINTAGYAVGPPITNSVFDAVGSYVPIFWIYLFVMAGITLMTLIALHMSQKERAA